jgi:hypothetical protein
LKEFEAAIDHTTSITINHHSNFGKINIYFRIKLGSFGILIFHSNILQLTLRESGAITVQFHIQSPFLPNIYQLPLITIGSFQFTSQSFPP